MILRNFKSLLLMAAMLLAGATASAQNVVEEVVPPLFDTDSLFSGVTLADSAAAPEPSDAAGFFVDAPTAFFPTIDRSTRLDMIDYFNAGSSKASANVVNGECRVISDTPEQIVVQTSGVSEVALALLPSSNKKWGDRILMVVTTLSTPAEDSAVKFYTTSWEPIEGVFEVPMLDDWMLPEAKKDPAPVQNALPFVIARLTYNPESRRAVFTHNLPDFVATEMLGVARSSIHPKLTFHWDGKRFVKEK